MQGKYSFKASFEGVSKTMKGARWCSDHSTKFMITLAKAAVLRRAEVVMAEKSPFPSVQLGLSRGGLFPGECSLCIGVWKSVVL